MTTTVRRELSETEKWCVQFKGCRGCKLESGCSVGPLDSNPYIKDGMIIDPWAIRTRKMILEEIKKQEVA